MGGTESVVNINNREVGQVRRPEAYNVVSTSVKIMEKYKKEKEKKRGVAAHPLPPALANTRRRPKTGSATAPCADPCCKRACSSSLLGHRPYPAPCSSSLMAKRPCTCTIRSDEALGGGSRASDILERRGTGKGPSHFLFSSRLSGTRIKLCHLSRTIEALIASNRELL